jgi:UDP-N-acetylmuramate--alanine ligase
MYMKPDSIGVLHFIGIGGIGMSGIAEVLHALGYHVQGSDIAQNYNTDRLQKKGIPVFIGHEKQNIENAAIIIISSAIKSDNPELAAARDLKLPIVRRAEMLGELMRLKLSIAISGTHGKTTTTSMVGAMLEEGGFDPTVINGGIVHKYGTNTRLGQGEWMVVEADESDGSFTKLPATVAVVTNIDPEHLDHYGTYDQVKAGFLNFIENIPFYGYAVLCIDHPAVQALIPQIQDRKLITYGFSPQANVRAVNVKSNPDGNIFDVEISNDGGGEVIVMTGVTLPMLGLHNVQNALAAIAIGHKMGLKPAVIKSALAGFSGVKRRFTKTGVAGGVTVIDDYGHHPVEIKAVLAAARQALAGSQSKIIAVVQPHRYTRLSSLMDEFCTCMNDADFVFIADVYAAGEQPIEGTNKESLVKGLRDHGHRHVEVLESPSGLARMVSDLAQNGDYVICLGAGDITKWAYALPEQLEGIFVSREKQRA